MVNHLSLCMINHLQKSSIASFNPSQKYESQIGSSSQLLGMKKHVPNHQPDTKFQWEPHGTATPRSTLGARLRAHPGGQDRKLTALADWS
jgi:hypothetical protein